MDISLLAKRIHRLRQPCGTTSAMVLTMYKNGIHNPDQIFRSRRLTNDLNSIRTTVAHFPQMRWGQWTALDVVATAKESLAQYGAISLALDCDEDDLLEEHRWGGGGLEHEFVVLMDVNNHAWCVQSYLDKVEPHIFSFESRWATVEELIGSKSPAKRTYLWNMLFKCTEADVAKRQGMAVTIFAPSIK